ncbi:MAG: dioxygenase [Chloroflexota bacterium]
MNMTNSQPIQQLLDRVAGLDNDQGDPRIKALVRRITNDLFAALEDLNVTEDEFWYGLHFLQQAAPQFGLIAPGLGFDHYLDVLMDERDRVAGIEGGTPRTIEGPLFVEGAPVFEAYADMRLFGSGGQQMELSGTIYDTNQRPISGAKVEIWHAGMSGSYSHFDPSLPEFAYRRCIMTDADGKYHVTTDIPPGYAVPPGSETEQLLDALGRHGRRPAHVHFFISALGYRHLTTQINIAGDPYLYDDFAFATRDELVAESTDKDGVAHVTFDFVVLPAKETADEARSIRVRMQG